MSRRKSGRINKNAKKEPQGVRRFNLKMQKKLVVLFGCVLLAFAGLGARLIWITRENGEQYKKQVLAQRDEYSSTTIPYRRGDIVDTKGTKLAVSEKVYNLVVDARVMLSDKAFLEPTLLALQESFEQLDMTQIRNHITEKPNSSWYVPLKQLTFDQMNVFLEKQKADKKNIKGIWFEPEYKRIYPNGSLACDVIGFTGSDNNGQFGLEEYYNDMLNGTTGREYGYLGDESTLERSVKPAVDGYNIHSTVDSNVQSIVDKYLKLFDDQYKNNIRPGSGAMNAGCVIMEVDTGNVLAMSSSPTFDLNNPKDLSPFYTPEEIAGFDAAGTTFDELNKIWRNFCVSDTYEPGSTAKPFTIAAGLEAGALTGNEVFDCQGFKMIGGHRIRCHTRSGDGPVTLQDSIAWSCNVALMEAAQALGAADFCKFQEAFNFGLKTNVDLAGEARTASFIYKADKMGDADLATNSFGQNFKVTMIQMITGYCALINGGYYYEPHLVSKITNANGATVQNIEPRVLKQVVSESTSEKIRQYCRATVMEEGGTRRTGKTARPAGYAIGGKTGTAQTLPRGNKEYVVSFIGYAPADDPKIAIYVVVDRPNVTNQAEAKIATTIVRNVLSEVLPYLNIFMTEELSEAEVLEVNQKQLEITSQYTKTPEGDALEGEVTGGDANNNPPANTPPPWSGFEKDPATGYLKDPDTGDLLDPETGEPVSGPIDPLDENAPIMPET